jgi:hypothetical protein
MSRTVARPPLERDVARDRRNRSRSSSGTQRDGVYDRAAIDFTRTRLGGGIPVQRKNARPARPPRASIISSASRLRSKRTIVRRALRSWPPMARCAWPTLRPRRRTALPRARHASLPMPPRITVRIHPSSTTTRVPLTHGNDRSSRHVCPRRCRCLGWRPRRGSKRSRSARRVSALCCLRTEALVSPTASVSVDSLRDEVEVLPDAEQRRRAKRIYGLGDFHDVRGLVAP